MRLFSLRVAVATSAIVRSLLTLAFVVTVAAPAFADRFTIRTGSQNALLGLTQGPTAGSGSSAGTAQSSASSVDRDEFGVLDRLGRGNLSARFERDLVRQTRFGGLGNARGILLQGQQQVAVPEPATLVLFGLGGLGFAIRRRRAR